MNQVQVKATAGTLDPFFAEKGVLWLPFPGIPGDIARAILALPQNKTLAVIPWLGSENPIAVARLNEDGTLDTQYGDRQSGYVELFFEGVEISIDLKLSALADGGCVIIGQYKSQGSQGLIVIRLRQDGSLVESFGDGGARFIPEEDFRLEPRGVEVRVGQEDEKDVNGAFTAQGNGGLSAAEDPDGKIVLASNTFDLFGDQKAVVLRLNANGSTDQSFNGGFAIVELRGVRHHWSSVRGVAVQVDGKVLVCGQYGDNESRAVFVMRFDAAGKVDAEFNRDRPVTIPSSEWIDFRSISVRKTAAADERIVVVGEATRAGVPSGLTVVLNTSGSYNLVFNNGEPLFSTLLFEQLYWRQCVLQTDGSVVAVGRADGAGYQKGVAVTARYRTDGSLDPIFNDGKGFAVFEREYGVQLSDGAVVMEDRRIVICGMWSGPNITFGGWVVRYLG